MPDSDAALGRRVRLARLARGMSQSELASRCGISRQAVAGVEAGEWTPSLRVALRMGVALERNVEQLFGDIERERELRVQELDHPAGPSGRAFLVEVFGRLVAVPQEGALAAVAGFGPASCRLQGPGTAHGAMPRERLLLVAGCDPALPLLAEGLVAIGSELRLIWWPCASARALALMRAGLVHAAGVHSQTGGLPAHAGQAAFGFAGWREGIAHRRGQPVASLGEALERGLRLANREEGSEARQLLDRHLQSLGAGAVPGYESHYRGHLPVAAAIADEGADFGVATEPAALALGLGFVGLSEEISALMVADDRLGSGELTALLNALAHPILERQLASLPGYDPAILGATL
jgi:putative molybdopterin biosynthesis protein